MRGDLHQRHVAALEAAVGTGKSWSAGAGSGLCTSDKKEVHMYGCSLRSGQPPIQWRGCPTRDASVLRSAASTATAADTESQSPGCKLRRLDEPVVQGLSHCPYACYLLLCYDYLPCCGFHAPECAGFSSEDISLFSCKLSI